MGIIAFDETSVWDYPHAYLPRQTDTTFNFPANLDANGGV